MLWGEKKEKEQAHTVMLIELFCEVSNISGSILVNERKGIVCLLMESQFWAAEDVKRADKHGMDVWVENQERELP